ncbi:hypothetical protein [Catenovulum maritimum]|uniref:DUF3806 domain-containing protein n=1 Tax=Catenovulum maritimum TaxID=1513271 RepID=A0A0J8JPL2_9ALTE|nr:hypothetical protein [Catenovulum maritimum]KMT66586.1 hypothetical protein XM47_03380 [Catenovulum maritimum]
MNQAEITKLMEESSQDAVQYIKSEYDVELDFSLESISLIDKAILWSMAKLKDEQDKEKFIFVVCNMFGAYIGETFKKHIGGEWLYDETDPEAPSVYLAFSGKTYAFAGICYEKLINDVNTSVKKYFDLAISNVTQ